MNKRILLAFVLLATAGTIVSMEIQRGSTLRPAIQLSNGKFLDVGWSTLGGTSTQRGQHYIIINRYNSDRSLDNTFGNNGSVAIPTSRPGNLEELDRAVAPYKQ